MVLLVHAKGFQLERKLREEIEKKIELGLARFSISITKVSAYLVDQNGPKGGVDKSMRIVIDIPHQSTIVIEETGESWTVLLDSVVDRASLNLSKQLKKSRSLGDRTSMAGDIDATPSSDPSLEPESWDSLNSR